jgi:hypothetical protein
MRQVRRLLVAFVLLLLSATATLAQTAGKGSVTITGSLQGPIYLCGNSSCPTYDTGQVAITVNGFTATATYGRSAGQRNANQLANALATSLKAQSSPVIASVSKSKISLTSKLTGTASNYPLSASVTHSSSFANASFTATVSGPTLTGGTGGPVPVSTLVQQMSNNTSACSSSSDPGGNRSYCSAFFNGFNSNPIDTAAETLIPDSPAGHVSNISIKQLMYPGWSGQLICEYQPWFGLSSHQSVGYNENNSATVAAQDSFMIAEGCDINLIDFYGALSSTQSFKRLQTRFRSEWPLREPVEIQDHGR